MRQAARLDRTQADAKLNPSWLAQRLLKGGSSRDVAILTLGTAIAQAITIASMPVLSRLYSPADFGNLSFFLAVSAIVATIITFRYEAAVLLPKHDQDAGTLVLISLLGIVSMSALLISFGLMFPNSFDMWLGQDRTSPGSTPAFIMAALSALLAVGLAWLNRQKRFLEMAGLRVLQSGGVALLALVLGFFPEFGWSGLIVSQMAGCLLVSAIAIYLSRHMVALWEKGRLVVLAMQYQSSPRYLLPTALLDVVTLQLPILLITSSFGPEEAGQFGMAMRVLALPAAVLGAAVGQVFLQRVAVLVHENVSQIRSAYYKVSFVLFAVGVVPALLLAFWGEGLFTLLLGSSWGPSGRIAEVLVFSSFIYFVFSPTSAVLQVLGKQQVLLAFGVLQLIYRVGAACLALDVLSYVRILVVCEFINVLLFEFVLLKQLGRAEGRS